MEQDKPTEVTGVENNTQFAEALFGNSKPDTAKEAIASEADIHYQIVSWSDREQRWFPFGSTGQEIYSGLSDAQHRYKCVCEWNPHQHFGIARVSMYPNVITTKEKKP